MRTHHARIIPEIALESMSAAYHWSPRDWLPWVGMCAVAIVSAIGFAWLQRDTRFQKRLAGHPLTFGGKRVPITPPSPAEAAAIRR